MNVDTFLTERRSAWQQLESLLTQTKTDIRRLSPQELADLGRLYRATTSDLALAQRDFPNQRVTHYLNGLVSRAHAQIYQEEPLRRQALVHFYRRDFPLLYRAFLPYTFLPVMVLRDWLNKSRLARCGPRSRPPSVRRRRVLS